MFNVLAVGSAFLASLVVSASAAPAPPPGGKTTVRVVSVHGSGCIGGTGSAKASADKRSFAVSYPAIRVSGEGGALGLRKNCQLALDVNVPRGYTYALSRIAHRGTGSLAAGASGDVSTISYFQGGSDAELTNHINGPLAGKWQRDNRIKPGARQFLPCGQDRYLNVNIALRVGSGGSLATDGPLVLEFARKKC